MSAEIPEDFVRAPAPGFRCSAAGDETGPRFVAKVRHILRPPASNDAVAKIQEMLGSHASQLLPFFRKHDGFVLYRDTLSDAAGIELLPVAEWQLASDGMRDLLEYLADDPESDPDHIYTGVAIGEVPHSGNYFVVPIEGPSAGKVFYANHDGWYESPFAENFDEFLAHVTREPARLLAEEVGCYTRYSDGKTDTQWIPEEYFDDVSTVEA